MEQLEAFIEKHWGLSGVKISKALQINGERKVFLLTTLEGNYILKLFHPELSENEIKKYTEVLLFLERSKTNIAPKLIKATDQLVYTRWENRYLYIMEYIKGMVLTETPENEYALGKAAAVLHRIQGYNEKCLIDTEQHVKGMLTRYKGYEFKIKYDEIIRELPDFTKLRQGFIHSDICPANAIRRLSGEVAFIDFDDAGNGSTFIDIGYPLISQFVQWENKLPGQPPPDVDKIFFQFEAAKAFYTGYYSVTPLTKEEKERIFDGAVFMQLLYFPIFGEEAVPFLWRQLTYALENKPMLMEALGAGDI